MCIRDRLPVLPEEAAVSGDDTYYIIFTSGSTGTPKGVQITADCLNHYLDWSVTLGTSPADKEGRVFLNQAPFSFDLSVMDLYTCLASGGTLFCLPKDVQGDYRQLLSYLERSGAEIWVCLLYTSRQGIGKLHIQLSLPGAAIILGAGSQKHLLKHRCV